MTVWTTLRDRTSQSMELARARRLTCLLPLGLLFLAPPLDAATILDTGIGANGPSIQQVQYVEQGWTQTQAYTNVSISIALFSWTPGADFDVTADLTNAVGVSAVAPAIATTSFTSSTADSTPQVYLLFSGLSLDPGTYYLTLSSTDNVGAQPGAIWPTECASGCPLTLDTGVTLLGQGFANTSFGSQNGSFAPASTFVAGDTPVNLTVIGDAADSSGTPEPSTLAQMLAAMTVLVAAGCKLRNRTLPEPRG